MSLSHKRVERTTGRYLPRPPIITKQRVPGRCGYRLFFQNISVLETWSRIIVNFYRCSYGKIASLSYISKIVKVATLESIQAR